MSKSTKKNSEAQQSQEAAESPNSVPTKSEPQKTEDESAGPRYRAGFYQFAIEDADGIFPASGVAVPVSECEDTVRGETVKVPMIVTPTVRVPKLRCSRLDCPHRRKNNDRAAEWYPEPPLRNLTLANARNMTPEEGSEWEQKWAERHAKSWLCPHCLANGVYEKGSPVKAAPMMPTPFKDVPFIRFLTSKEAGRLEELLDPDRKPEYEYGEMKLPSGATRKVRVGMIGGAIKITRTHADEFRGTRLKKEFPAGPMIKWQMVSDDESYEPYDPVAEQRRNASLLNKLRSAVNSDDSGKIADLLKDAGIDV